MNAFLADWKAPCVEVWDGFDAAAADDEVGASPAPDWLLDQVLCRGQAQPLCLHSSRGDAEPMYRRYRALATKWEPCCKLPEGIVQRCPLQRVLYSATAGQQWATFHIYRIVVGDSQSGPTSQELCEAAAALQSTSDGIAVSNIGGGTRVGSSSRRGA